MTTVSIGAGKSGGAWQAPHGAGVIDVLSSATETVVGRVPRGTLADVDLAVQAARLLQRHLLRESLRDDLGVAQRDGGRVGVAPVHDDLDRRAAAGLQVGSPLPIILNAKRPGQCIVA